MSQSVPRVVIVGGGLAGPCLAHGLLRAGIDAVLCERDVAARAGGYRIHISPEGDLALRLCLPPNLYRLVRATDGIHGSGVHVLAEDLTELKSVTITPSPEEQGVHLTVDRLTFRQILLHGLGGALRFGAAFTHYEELADGRVRVHFADGTTEDADLLVGTDGANSRVRRQFLPHARVVEIGTWAVFGKTPLTERTYPIVPAAAFDGFSSVAGSNGRFMPVAAHRYSNDPQSTADEHAPGLVFTDTSDYVMWVLGVPTEALLSRVPDPRNTDGTRLCEVAVELIADWHRNLHALIGHSDIRTVRALPMQTSIPFEHWDTGPVTLVGDAIHAMVPAGNSAAVALRDAGELTRRIAASDRDPAGIRSAVHGYEVAMLDYGFAAVEESKNLGANLAARS